MPPSAKPVSVRPPSNEHPAEHSFRILSIDGGGIRGLIPAVLLQRLEELAQTALEAATPDVAAPWRQHGIDRIRIADCFHLIAGTSTGGLLAAGLTVPHPNAPGRPKFTAAEAGRIYLADGAAIFRRPGWRKVTNPLALRVPKYPLGQLEEVLKRPDVLGNSLLRDACTEVLITTYDTINRRHRNFTRWGARGAREAPAVPEILMRDAALGTAAAPTYFPPHAADGSNMVDGGVFAGNPTLAAIGMALRRTEHPLPALGGLLVVSLGTGLSEQALDYGRGGIIGWARPRKEGEALLGAILDGQADHATESAHLMLNGWPANKQWWDPTLLPDMLGGGPRFWRYQPRIPQPWAMDDITRLPDLKQVGEELRDHYRTELSRLATAIVNAGPAFL